MIFDIITDPNPLLHKRSADVDVSKITSHEMQKFIKDMIETMRIKDGVGLAAVQVGKPIQLLVIVKDYNTYSREDLCLINPIWTKISRHSNVDEEGCLSVPALYGKVKRYSHIEVKAYDKNGKPITFEAKNFFARIIQHECDHLDGHLFIEKAKDVHKIEPAL